MCCMCMWFTPEATRFILFILDALVIVHTVQVYISIAWFSVVYMYLYKCQR